MKKMRKRLLYLLAGLFVLLNVVSFFHAWKFTHFDDSPFPRQKNFTTAVKAKMLFTGINNPRPANRKFPTQQYESVKIKSNKTLGCWSIKTKNAKGTVILFHGYAGEKSTMVDKSDEFLKMGYNTLLVDFMGSGQSEGMQTTIGYKEAQEVKDCYDYIAAQGEKKIYLFGTSMGAAAILKSLNDYNLQPAAVMVECPFGSMYKTTVARFKLMGVPAFPMAHMLLFWGSVQNGFNAFAHNPQEYAKGVKCPTLLLYGEKDSKVSPGETQLIYQNLQGPKQLVTYPNSGHENYLLKYHDKWVHDVSGFITTH